MGNRALGPTMVGALALTTCVWGRNPVPRRPLQAQGALTVPLGAPQDASSPARPVADRPRIPDPLRAVVEAVQRGEWGTARARGDSLPPAVGSTREARFVRARVALEAHDPAGALRFTRGLGAEAPFLGADVAALEAQALTALGRHAEARARWLSVAARPDGDRETALAEAAVAAHAAGDSAAAAQEMRGWIDNPPRGRPRAESWKVAALAFEAAGERDLAVAAWTRIAVDEPDGTSAGEALAALTRLAVTLDPERQLRRAETLLARGRASEALPILQRLAPTDGAAAPSAATDAGAAPQGTPAPVSVETRRLRTLGRCLLALQGRALEAFNALSLASQRTDNATRDEDGYLAARALSRADRDAEAVAAFDAVAAGYRGRWSDEAAFRAAWLEARHDHLDAALGRFGRFVAERPGAQEKLRVDAAWYQGWLQLRAGRAPEAAAALDLAAGATTHAGPRTRARYWASVARWRAGQRDLALDGWRALLRDRPFGWYGLLAEARLRAAGETPTAWAAPPERRAPPSLALPARVQWLHASGMDRDAASALAEAEHALRGSLPADRGDEAMALAYLSLGDARRAYVLGMRNASALDAAPTEATRWVWDAAFPRPWQETTDEAERENNLGPSTVASFMRQESGFSEGARSPVGALGLVQLMPATAGPLAAQLHEPFTSERLLEPRFNLRLAGRYLGQLQRQFRGVLAHTAAAYNGGPGYLTRWLREWPTDDVDALVERIPLPETQGYVQAVLSNLTRYRYLYGPREGLTDAVVTLRREAPAAPSGADASVAATPDGG
ncbi:MAG: lytic transglycosylase domain-containing protein [Deltaproteobacteria bacterium]|nr:lytic transglycosylase domain-containing protein [Deltaproteobacteria bacterium]